MKEYNPHEIEPRWQKVWAETGAHKATEDTSKPKRYVLEMFPYPSGDIHMGHVRNYTIGDVTARYYAMRGYDVLHPMGWDAFGLPAENAAIKHNSHPAKWTYANIETQKASFKRMGFSYDWDRTVVACDPEYYRWGQWIFLQMYKRGLVERRNSPVNWCPNCKTVLANEQVTEGECWRCHGAVEKRDLTQWYYKITDYAQELLDDLDQLEGWPEPVKQMQANWIGRSEGAEVDFELIPAEGKDDGQTITVFTTRPDTLFGCSFFLLAPESPLVHDLVCGTEYEAEVMALVEGAAKVSAVERAQGDREKSAGLLQNGILFYGLLGLTMAVVQYAAIPLLYHLGQPAEVVDMAIPYYKMLVYSMPFIMLFFTFKQFLEGVGNTKVEMAVTIVANLANIGFNWVFIYGRYGFPEMGAEGAGLGTLLSRIIAPMLMIGYFYSRSKYRVYLEGFSPRNYSWASVRQLLHMGLPISMQMFLEASAFVGTGIMMGWFNKETMSANQIATTIGNCAFMIVMSIGAATTIRVSHCYGARDIGQLSLAAKASYHLVLAWNALAALVFITMRNVIPTLFTTNAEVIAIASQLMVFAALYQLSDGIQNVSVGILRGIQDVKIIMPIAFVSYWLLNLPVGYLFGFTMGMGPSGLFLGFSFGLSAAAVMMILRIRRSISRLHANGNSQSTIRNS